MARLLRTDLPDDVWDRLSDEAAEHGMKIGAYLRRLVIKRDAKRHPVAHRATGSTTPSN